MRSSRPQWLVQRELPVLTGEHFARIRPPSQLHKSRFGIQYRVPCAAALIIGCRGLERQEVRSMQPEAIRSLIANHLAVPMDAVRDSAGFATDLGADSLDMIELAMRFEEELDISIADDEGEA